MQAFKEEYPEASCFFLVPSQRREIYRGFPLIPVEEFLLHLAPDSNLSDAIKGNNDN